MSLAETRWWWVRHAPVTDDGGCIYGQRDLAANCSDSATFDWLARELPEQAVMVTSDLQRTIQTGDSITGAGLGVVETLREPAFKEQYFGDWQGMPREEFANMTSKLAHRFWIAPAFERTPNGESFTDVIARVAPAIVRLTAEHAGRDIISVAHGGSIRAAIAFALRLDPDSALRFSVRNLSVTRLDHIETADGEGVWRVHSVNRLPSFNEKRQVGW